MMNLNTTIDFDLKRFFLWWGRELSLCLPERIRQLLSDKVGYVFLTVNAGKLIVSENSGDQANKLASLDLNENIQQRFEQLINEKPELEKAHFILRLSADQAIKKIIYLPAAAKENLRQVVAFELDKFTPFNEQQVYFALKILAKEENGKVKVLLVYTPRHILDAIHQRLIGAQIYPDVVDYESAPNNFVEDLDIYNLLPDWEQPGKNKVVQLVVGLLSVVLFLMMLASLIYPVWNEGQEVDRLRQQLKLLRNDTLLVKDKQQEIDGIVEETTRLINAKNNAPSLLELINTVSQLIPDDSWLTHMKYSKGALQIQGQAPTASALIAVLEASPLFINARFVSPLTQDKRTGMERFQISMDVNIKENTEDGQ